MNTFLEDRVLQYNDEACCAPMQTITTRLEHELHTKHSDATRFAEDFFSFLRAEQISRVTFLPEQEHIAIIANMHSAPKRLTNISHALYSNFISFLVSITQGRLLHRGATFFHYDNDGLTISGRVVYLSSENGNVISLYLHHNAVHHLTLADIGIRDPHVALLARYLQQPGVAVIIVGPESSGKTTTVAALLRFIIANGKVAVMNFDQHPELQVDGVMHVYDDMKILQHVTDYDVDILNLPDVSLAIWYENYVTHIGPLLRQGIRLLTSVTADSLDDFIASLDAMPRMQIEELLTHGTTILVVPKLITRRGQKKLTLKTLPLDAGLRSLFLSGATFSNLLHHARGGGF